MEAEAGFQQQQHPRLLIFISSGANNTTRRRALRNSWFKYKSQSALLPAELSKCVDVVFLIARGTLQESLVQEAEEHKDVCLVDAPEGYEHLWRKALVLLDLLVRGSAGSDGQSVWGGSHWAPAFQPEFVMHADDDSFVRLDLLLPEMVSWPRTRHYWGYVWDGTGARTTAPIRNPLNKSHMPDDQYPLDYYPPFCSGCGFVLSWDLVQALVAQPLPDYRLLDPPFGIHLCGPPSHCILPEPVIPVHDERVRPYRPIPIFRADTLVQHYLRPEEMKPFLEQAIAATSPVNPSCTTRPGEQKDGLGNKGTVQAGSSSAGSAPEQLYDTLVQLGLLRR